MNSLEFREQRAQLVADSKKWLTEAEANSLPEAEVTEGWAKRMTEVDRLEAEANKSERREKLDRLDTDLSKPMNRKSGFSDAKQIRQLSKQEKNSALRSWLSVGSSAKVRMDERSVSLCAEAGMPLDANHLEVRAITAFTAGTGGNAVYGSIAPDLEVELKYYSDVLNKCKIYVTGDGQDFVLPKATDVSRAVSIVSEGGDSDDSTDPTFAKVTMKAYVLRCIQPITYEMLQDNRFDVEAYVSQALAEAFGRTVEQYLVTGTNSSQPQGFIPASGNTVTLAATKKNFYRFDDLMAAIAAVDPAYRKDASFVFNDSSVWDIRKIVDSQGRYLRDIGNPQIGMPDRLLGYPYLVSNSVDASGVFSKKIGWFGCLNRHAVRLSENIQFQRLNELYAKKGMVAVQAMLRFDSKYVGHANSSCVIATPAS